MPGTWGWHREASMGTHIGPWEPSPGLGPAGGPAGPACITTRAPHLCPTHGGDRIEAESVGVSQWYPEGASRPGGRLRAQLVLSLT
jgi:hypothetical protein